MSHYLHERIKCGKMRFLVLIPPSDFSDESMELVDLFFNKWGIEYEIASYTRNACIGSHGGIKKPTLHANSVTVFGYDAFMLIDGIGVEKYKLYEYRPLLDMVYSFHSHKKVVWAIGNAIKIAARANIIKDKKVSVPQSADVRGVVNLFRGILSTEPSEVQGNICTVGNPSNLELVMPGILAKLGIK